jgi:hypothetical protein
MAPRVYSSVKEAWAGVLSGAVPLTKNPSRRRVSCSAIDVPTQGSGGGDGTGRSGSSSPVNKDVASSTTKEDFPPHRAPETQASTSEESYTESDDEAPFECKVFVQLSDDSDDDDKNQVNIGSLTDEDLRRLKETDPFLYYSIPSIRRRSYRFDIAEDEEQDATAIRMAMTRTAGATSRRASMPAQVLANADISRSRQEQRLRHDMQEAARLVLLEEDDDGDEEDLLMDEEPVSIMTTRRASVTRCRRLSTEAHPTLICNELLEELEGLDFSDDDDEEDEIDVDLEDLERQLSGL